MKHRKDGGQPKGRSQRMTLAWDWLPEVLYRMEWSTTNGTRHDHQYASGVCSLRGTLRREAVHGKLHDEELQLLSLAIA